MAYSKLVIFYNSGQSGWTETWYTATPPTSFNPQEPVFQNFLLCSIRLRAQPCYILGVRVSQIGTPGLARSFSLQQRFSGNYWAAGTANGNPDVVSTDAYCTIYDTQSNRRSLSIRGLPDTFVSYLPDGTPNPPTNFIQNLQQYFLAAYSNNFLIQSELPINGTTQVKLPISSIGTGTNPSWAIMSTNNLGSPALIAGNKVRFLGVNKDNLPGFPRIATIVGVVPEAPPANSFVTIPWRFRASTNPYLPFNMSMVLMGYQYNPMAYNSNTGGPAFNFLHYGERKTGKPIGSLRGRSRSLVRAE